MTNKEIKRKINKKYQDIRDILYALPVSNHRAMGGGYGLTVFGTLIEIIVKRDKMFQIYSSNNYIEHMFDHSIETPKRFSGIYSINDENNIARLSSKTKDYIGRFSRPKQLKILSSIEKQLYRLMLEQS
jgi:hypothetical protein